METRQLLRTEVCVVGWLILLGLAAEVALGVMRKIPTQELMNRCQWIVIGQVNEVQGEWNADQTMIYTCTTLCVRHWIKGEAQEDELLVRTEGGQVGTFRCDVSDEPRFNVGETVLLFLEPLAGYEGLFKVTGLFQGKYTIRSGTVVENGLALSDFVHQLGGELTEGEVEEAEQIDADDPARPPAGYVYGDAKWPDDDFPIMYYINEDGFDTCVFDGFQAIHRGARAWEQIPGAYWALCYGGTTTTAVHGIDDKNTITFESLGDPQGKAYIHSNGGWIYECDMAFDDDLDWSAASNDSCKALHLDVESVATHEFGHWLYLKHTDVHGATMTGSGIAPGQTFQRYPAPDDMEGIRSIYPHTPGAPEPQPGCWPWWPGLMNNFASAAVMVDMDRDGIDEVLVGAIGDANGIWALKGDGSADWEAGITTLGLTSLAAPASADLDLDNWEDVITGGAGGQVYARGRKDTAVQGWPVNDPGAAVYSSPAIGNIDALIGLEVVAGSDDGKVYAWNSIGVIMDRDGQAPWDWPRNTGGMVRSSPALGDLDGDEDPDIVVGSDDGKVYAWDYTGTAIVGWPKATGDMVRSSPALGDIDDDDELEVIVGSDDGNVYAWNADGTVVDGDGMAPWDWPQATGAMVRSSPALGDIDGDGDLDVVVGCDDGNIYAWDHTGISLAGWPVATGGAVRSSPVIGDIDGDQQLEVVVGSDDHNVYGLDADGGNATGWPWATSGPVQNTPALGDIDGNNELEVCVAMLPNEWVNTFMCRDLGSPYDPAYLPWPVFGHDRYHTSQSGFQPPPVIPLPRWHDGDPGWGDDEWGSDSNGCPLPDYSGSTYVSPPYSLEITGSGSLDAYAWLQSKDVNISLSQVYHVRFFFRPVNFYQTKFFEFGHVKLLLESPAASLHYDTTGDEDYVPIGPPVADYLFFDTWTLFEIDVDPSASEYTITATAGGPPVPVGTASYASSLPPSRAMYMEDGPDTGSVLEGNYDDFEITGTVLPALPFGPGDFDGDGDVDAADGDLFETCASGPGIPPPFGCEAKDLDGDEDVDQSDFGMFQRCYSGEDNPADPSCVY